MLSTSATRVHSQHDDMDVIVGGGADPVPIVHDSTIFLQETRLDAAYGLSPRWGIGLTLPFRVVDAGIAYRDPSDDEVALVTANIHHRNETLTGLADPTLLVRFGQPFGKLQLEAKLGATLPLGKTEEDPFRLGDLGLPHEHVQFGTGTINPVLGLGLSRSVGRASVGAWVQTTQALYESDKQYKPGDRYLLGAAVVVPVGAWRLRGGAELMAETADEWRGMTYDNEGNQGRIDLLLSAGAAWRLSPQVALDASVQVPVYAHVEGGQLAYPLVANVGVTMTFDLLSGGGGGGGGGESAHGEDDGHGHGEDDGHGHGHGEDDGHGHGDAAAVADVQEVVTDGSVVALTAVAGKITVYDFWAPWCKPCKELDAGLAALAAAHPDRIAIRKINVVDWDSEAAARYLTPGGFGLPHLKVLLPDGQVVVEQSGSPPLLVAAVADTLAASAPERIELAVGEDGYQPSTITVRAGVPVTLVFIRRVAGTCGTDVNFTIPGGAEIRRDLPLGEPVAVTVTFPTAAKVPFGCSMDKMVGGVIDVVP